MNSRRLIVGCKPLRHFRRNFTSETSKTPVYTFKPPGNECSKQNPAPPSFEPCPDVPGLSCAVILPASKPVGPNVDPKKTGPYKNPEYYCYHNMSYFEAETEMAKYRCPQPSSRQCS